MSIVLAFAASVFWGSANLVGGVAARRTGAIAVSFSASIICSVLLLPVVTVAAGSPSEALVVGIAAGVAAALGSVCTFKALELAVWES